MTATDDDLTRDMVGDVRPLDITMVARGVCGGDHYGRGGVAVSDLSEQIAAYDRVYPPVPLDATPGALVVFHGNGGYLAPNAAARRVLTIGATYVLAGSSIGSWESTLFLEGFDIGFDSVMFSPAATSATP